MMPKILKFATITMILTAFWIVSLSLFASAGEFLNLKINEDSTTQLQNEEQIAVNPLNGQNVVAVWRDFRLGYRQVGAGSSMDGGLTWIDQLLVEPRFTLQSDPGLTYDIYGNFYAVVLSYEAIWDSNSLAVLKSSDGGQSWGNPSYAVVSGPQTFEDKELIACDRSNAPTQGNLYISWTRFYQVGGTEIVLVRSTDGGTTWSTPVQVSDAQGVQWSVPVVGANGEVYVAWVDFGSYNILIDKSTDGGFTFGSDVSISPVNFPSGDLNGGITVFSFPALDADLSGGPFNGTLVVAYMDDGGTDMDIFFRRSTDEGTTWSPAIRINDDPMGNGSDQFHPWLTVDQNGTITIVFYDRRLDPGNLLFDLYMTQSFDGGITFTPNERISDVSSVPLSEKNQEPKLFAPGRAGLMGEYIGVASYYGKIHPIWTDTRNGNQDVYTGVDTSHFRDVGVVAIDLPDTVPCDTPVVIPVTFCNFGDSAEYFLVGCELSCPGSSNAQATFVDLFPDSCITVNFDFSGLASWPDSECCNITAFTSLANDMVPSNDTLVKEVCSICPVGVSEESDHSHTPSLPKLLQNIPNPFFAGGIPTTIRYSLQESSLMTLRIYNIAGGTVKTLEEGKKEKGSYQVEWNGRDEDGVRVGSGVYFYKMKTKGFSNTRKIILLGSNLIN